MNYRKQWTSVSNASAGGVEWVLRIGHESCWWNHGQKCNESSLENVEWELEKWSSGLQKMCDQEKVVVRGEE